MLQVKFDFSPDSIDRFIKGQNSFANGMPCHTRRHSADIGVDRCVVFGRLLPIANDCTRIGHIVFPTVSREIGK